MTPLAVSWASRWVMAASLAAVAGTLAAAIILRRRRDPIIRLAYSKTATFIFPRPKVSDSVPLAPHNSRFMAHESLKDPGIFILPRLLRWAAIALFILALGRPQRLRIEQIEPLLGVDILLALDTSPSMQSLDFQPFNRLQAAKKLALNFIDKRKGDRMGLVVFGGAAVLTCPPTLDHNALKSFLNQVEIGMTKVDGTAIGSGLMASLAHLRKIPSKSKIVVLLTDGRSNAGSIDPMTAAKTASALGVKVYTIGTGKRGGGLFPVVDPVLGMRYIRRPEEEIDEDTLTKMAQLTGGRYYRATELGELKLIFDDINSLEKTVIEPPRIIHYEELYPSLVIAALVLLAAEALLRSTALLTLP